MQISLLFVADFAAMVMASPAEEVRATEVFILSLISRPWLKSSTLTTAPAATLLLATVQVLWLFAALAQ